jgi:uracil-DNA glycosylase
LTALAAARNPWPGVLEPPREIVKAAYGDGYQVYPNTTDVFAAFQLTPFDKVKVVILGQDPYPNPDDATGLAFAVRPGRRLPTSLANIHLALQAEGITPPEDLTEWATQGVLLLNTALTVPHGRPGGDLKLWRPFTEQVIQALNGRGTPVVWVLWGRKAQRWHKLIDPDTVVTAPHPAARGAHRAEFINARTFSRVNQELVRLGQDPINWDPSHNN